MFSLRICSTADDTIFGPDSTPLAVWALPRKVRVHSSCD